MYIYLFIFSLFFSSLNCNSLFEQSNNLLLIETIKLQKNCPDITYLPYLLKILKNTYLKNIESDIKEYCMPKEIKETIGDIEKIFSKFKKKIEIISRYSWNISDENTKHFLLAVAGLKPLTVELDSAQFFLMLEINQVFPRELSSGKYLDMINNKVFEYVVCHDPIFCYKFVKMNYPESKETKEFIVEFEKMLNFPSNENILYMLGKYWNINNFSSTISYELEDELAYLLGYVPTICDKNKFNQYNLFDQNKFLKDIILLHPEHFRMKLIPGMLDFSIISAYTKLYEKFIEYFYISLLGIDGYLCLLDCIFNQEFSKTQNYNNIEKIITNAYQKNPSMHNINAMYSNS